MKISLIPLALALFAVPAAVQGQAAKTPDATQIAPEAGVVTFGADQTNYDDANGLGVFSGNVTATQTGEDFILYAQKAKFAREQNTAEASKELRIETRESTIRGERLVADFNKKVFYILGSVRITSYGEDDGVAPDIAAPRRADQKRKPVRIACDRLDWNYDTRQATLVGNIRIVSQESVGTCNQIIYDETRNAARLQGDVRFGNPKRQQFLADELTIFVDSGAIQNTTGVRITGPVSNAADGEEARAPKPIETFPDAVGIGDDFALPKPPADIEKFLPKPGVPQGKPPKIPAEKPVPATEPAIEPAISPKDKPATTPKTDETEPKTDEKPTPVVED